MKVEIDNEKLWELIENYNFKSQTWAELLALHEDGFAEPVVKARKEMEDAESQLRKALNLPEED